MDRCHAVNQEKPRKSASIQENKVDQILTTRSQRHVKTVLVWTREQNGSIIFRRPHLHPGNTLTTGGLGQVGQLKPHFQCFCNRFRLQSIPIHCNRRTHLAWLKVSKACLHKISLSSSCHPCLMSVLCPFLIFVHLLY